MAFSKIREDILSGILRYKIESIFDKHFSGSKMSSCHEDEFEHQIKLWNYRIQDAA